MRAHLLWIAAFLAACGPKVGTSDDVADDGATSDGAAPDGSAPTDAPVAVFPEPPIIEPGAPANAPGLFGDPSTGSAGGPCVAEPATGSLIPAYFLRPRFRLIPSSGENLFEIRLHAAGSANDLVAYTTAATWTIPAAVWAQMSDQLDNQPITYTTRSARWNGTSLDGPPLLGGTGSFRIAPVRADGSIVYWTNGTGSTASFKGFTIGDESAVSVLQPSTVGGGVTCVGCHTSTPDGAYVAFSAVTDPVRGDLSSIDIRSIDGTASRPPFLTPAALTLLARTPNHEAPVFSPAHWAAADHMALSMYPVANRPEIMWTNLEATSTAQGMGWGVVARTGDPGQAGAAAWSHDGTTIAYTSAPLITSGMNADDGFGDLYRVPYNGGAGGTATKLAGASDPAFTEHYAAFSRDDKLIAFVRLGGNQNAYNNALTEVYVVPAAGGTATRLAANQATECSAVTSPGIGNTWPKWSPTAESVGGVTYYWLTFSSKRKGTPQLYVAPLTVDAQGVVTTYPALYLWNQPANEHNHTPAWDVFDIPID